MENEFLYKNPNLIIEPVEDGFFVVINPLKKDALKLINAVQRGVLDSLDGPLTLSALSDRSGLSGDALAALLDQFNRLDFISRTGSFEGPRSASKPGSLNLWVQTTNSCNLRCGYCYIRTKDERTGMDDSMMALLGERIVETAAARRLKRVSLRVSGGEPFLVFEKWNVFLRGLRARLSGSGCGLRAVFLTNGTVMTGAIAETVKREDYRIAISMDGLKSFHDRARRFADGSGSYAHVVRTMDLLRSRGVPYSLMTVVSDDNLPNLAEFTKFLLNRGERFRFSIVDGVGIDWEMLSRNFRECLSLMEKRIRKGHSVTKLFKLCDLKFSGASLRTCASGYSGGAVYVDGSLHFCQKHFGQDKSLGSLSGGEDLIEIAQRGRGFDEMPQECGQCRYRYICSGGCPLERRKGRGAECGFYREFIPEIIRLMGLERLVAVRKKVVLDSLKG